MRQDQSSFQARLRASLGVGAITWLALLLAGLGSPAGGVVWARAAAIGSPEYAVVAFWLATLVLAPLFTLRDPLKYKAILNVYMLGALLLLTATFAARLRGELPPPLSDGVPAATALSAGLVLWAHFQPGSKRP